MLVLRLSSSFLNDVMFVGVLFSTCDASVFIFLMAFFFFLASLLGSIFRAAAWPL